MCMLSTLVTVETVSFVCVEIVSHSDTILKAQPICFRVKSLCKGYNPIIVITPLMAKPSILLPVGYIGQPTGLPCILLPWRCE